MSTRTPHHSKPALLDPPDVSPKEGAMYLDAADVLSETERGDRHTPQARHRDFENAASIDDLDHRLAGQIDGLLEGEIDEDMVAHDPGGPNWLPPDERLADSPTGREIRGSQTVDRPSTESRRTHTIADDHSAPEKSAATRSEGISHSSRLETKRTPNSAADSGSFQRFGTADPRQMPGDSHVAAVFLCVEPLFRRVFALLGAPMKLVPPSKRRYVDWIALTLAFWTPIVWLIALNLLD